MAYLLSNVTIDDIPLEKQHIQMVVPFGKAHAFRLLCKNCDGFADVPNGLIALGLVSNVNCPKCQTEFPMEKILPIMQAAKEFYTGPDGQRNCDLALVIRLDRCATTFPLLN